MQDGRVRGIDATFQSLDPVALLPGLVDLAVTRGHGYPVKAWRRRLELRRAHIGPDNVADLHHRICGEPYFVEKRLWLIHLFQAHAVDVKFPSVIDTPNTILLVSSKPERRESVGARLIY